MASSKVETGRVHCRVARGFTLRDGLIALDCNGGPGCAGTVRAVIVQHESPLPSSGRRSDEFRPWDEVLTVTMVVSDDPETVEAALRARRLSCGCGSSLAPWGHERGRWLRGPWRSAALAVTEACTLPGVRADGGAAGRLEPAQAAGHRRGGRRCAPGARSGHRAPDRSAAQGSRGDRPGMAAPGRRPDRPAPRPGHGGCSRLRIRSSSLFSRPAPSSATPWRLSARLRPPYGGVSAAIGRRVDDRRVDPGPASLAPLELIAPSLACPLPRSRYRR